MDAALSLFCSTKQPVNQVCLQNSINEVPLYVIVKEVLNKEAHVEAVEINYLTFYAFNGPYTIGLPPFSFEAGAHDGDWEHFTVR